jgi:hypothetical protein
VFQDHPAHRNIKFLFREWVILNVPKDLLVQGGVSVQLLPGNVNANGVYLGLELEMTGRTTAGLEQVDAALTLQEGIGHFTNEFDYIGHRFSWTQ